MDIRGAGVDARRRQPGPGPGRRITATTVSCDRRTRQSQKGVPVAALTVMVASAAVFPRVLTEMAVVDPNTFWKTAPPLGIMLGWMMLIDRPRNALPSVGEGTRTHGQRQPSEPRSD
jgi:hypothetical protein